MSEINAKMRLTYSKIPPTFCVSVLCAMKHLSLASNKSKKSINVPEDIQSIKKIIFLTFPCITSRSLLKSQI